MDRKLLLAIMIFIFCALGFIDMAKADTLQLCSKSSTKEFWKNYSKLKLKQKLEKYGFSSSNKSLVNAIITESYQDFIDLDQHLDELSLIGYFYSHASFHLGRIARYRHWESNDPFGLEDKKLIFGKRLRYLLKVESRLATRKLMYYSEDLYYELSWSLYALKNCGKKFTLSLIEDSHLKGFFEKDHWFDKISSFVTYEQAYLQTTLYKDRVIAPMVKLGIIDQMRWIPFGDEIFENFYEWCQRSRCKKTSFDLNSRIIFDTKSLYSEWLKISNLGLERRMKESSVFDINIHFMSNYSK